MIRIYTQNPQDRENQVTSLIGLPTTVASTMFGGWGPKL